MSGWQLDEEAYKLLLQRVNETKDLVERQNGRVRKLEMWRNRLLGAWGVIAVILAVIGKKIGLW